ncbi:hypothetical protein WICMUC_001706 [Wickerhamomyces mucosus]|uniref:HD domain-containing protein n=1 Tax=Wickerhamomyces mucosus TaxID=1378264 RepID=A0A9P8PSN0_9ASCO|nr:hypothetical protein WICMUC_001706 [Wickerhamomyces mucosus]
MQSYLGLDKVPTFNFSHTSTGTAVNKDPKPLSDLSLPNTELCNKALKLAHSELSHQNVNHSIRLFLYGRAIIAEQLKHWSHIDEEVLFVVALFHYFGFKDVKTSKVSFQLDSAMLAREFILKESLDEDFACVASEAIIRQTFINVTTGYISQLGLILQMALVLDNFKSPSVLEYVNPKTIEEVEKAYPAEGWREHLANAIDEENQYKPWGLTSTLGENFKLGVLGKVEFP